MIPRRIIRCYRSMYLFTPAMVETEKRLKAMHPEPAWEHLFFNHYEARDWVREHAPEWLDLYEFYPVDRQREQIFRWLAVWKLGGIWLSTQMRPLAPLDPLVGEFSGEDADATLPPGRRQDADATLLPENFTTLLSWRRFFACRANRFARR
ncbi:MAG: hypothetical protein R3F11_27990 [Verrucomicrobiales bacterium]